MKKILFALTVLFALNSYSQTKKIAVVSFYTNKTIGLSALGLDGLASVTDLGNNPNFNLTPILEKYHDAFFNVYSKRFPFELLPENVVTQKKEYIDFTPKYDKKDDKNAINYTGYKYIYDGIADSSNEVGVAKMFSEVADGILFTEIHFDLQKGFGIGGTASLKMRATARISLYDKNGKKVFAINEGEDSKKTGVMVGGVPILTPEKILPMCESALEELMKDLDGRIAKIVKKTAEKL
jgi:hypothetical protein